MKILDAITNRLRRSGGSGPPKTAAAYAGSLGMVAVALGLGLLLQRTGAGASNAGLVFLTAVLMSAATYGLGPGLAACFISALAYNFFFFPPLYTFTIADPRNVVTITIFGVVALIASNLAARIRTQSVAAETRAATMESLYLFSRKLAGAFTMDDLLWAIAFQFADMLHTRVVILLPAEDGLRVRAGYPPEDFLTENEMAVARRAWEQETPPQAGPTEGGSWLFWPMRTGRGKIGIAGFERQTGQSFPPETLRLLDSLADQAALAIERLNLSVEYEEARLAARTEKLRSAVLTSLSHDLKTPLASILGSASALKTHGTALRADAQRELIATIHDEAERLNQFIANLLDMTRLESGAISPKLEPMDLGDVVGSALRRAGPLLDKHRIRIDLEPNLPMVRIDPVLFEQSLFNLLDNASKYSDSGSLIEVRARTADRTVELEVRDEGVGIPAGDVDRVFDKFFRAHAGDRKRSGTGLGLSICRGFVEAMGGTIAARNRSDGHGSEFKISFPVSDDLKEQAA